MAKILRSHLLAIKQEFQKLPKTLPSSSTARSLLESIRSRQARCGVIGLGYVGLPLAVEFARAGFVTTGIDLDPAKVRAINEGRSYIDDVAGADVAQLQSQGRLKAVGDFDALRELDTVNICVPTPLRKTRDPDLSFIVAAGPGVPPALGHRGRERLDRP